VATEPDLYAAIDRALGGAFRALTDEKERAIAARGTQTIRGG
jgi:hypothetical protein